MSIRLPQFFLGLIWIAGAGIARADETIPLIDYLDLANQSGLQLIYSSDLVPHRYRVTYNPDKPIDRQKIDKALAAYGLKLSSVNDNVLVVERDNTSPELNAPQPITDSWQAPSIEEVVVSSSRYRLFSSHTVSNNLFNAAQLQQRPVIGNDVSRVVNQLPGSATVGLSARPRVRGGNEDETLIMFDGIRLYEPFHFNHYNNLFSSFDSRILSSIDFYSGGFPVPLGDRMSAAMVMETKSPEELTNKRELGVGLFNVSYYQSAVNENESWLFNARRSNLELLSSLVEADLGDPSFGDIFTRYTRQLANGDAISVNLLWFGDDTDINNAGRTEALKSIYGNTYLWLNHERSLTENLFVTSKLAYSRIKNDREGQVNKPGQVVGELEDNRTFKVFNVKQDYEWYGEVGMLTFGWDYRYLDARYEFNSILTVDPRFAGLSNVTRPAAGLVNVDETGHQAALYINWKKSLTDVLTFELGSRLDAQHYEHSTHANGADVRLGLLYELGPETSLRFGWGRFSQAQGIHELNISDQESAFQPGQRADHMIISLAHQFSDRYNLRIEAYEKNADKVRAYYQNLTNPLNIVPELQADRFRVNPDGYKASGVELSFEAEFDVARVWANFSYSKVEDELPGNDIKRSWDQAQSANIGMSTSVGKWDVSAIAGFHEGWLTTPLMEQGGNIVPGLRNSQRFDHYLSVDTKVIRTWQLSGSELRLEAGLTNLLDRENQIGVTYDLDSNNNLIQTPEYGLPLAPFVDVFWSF